MNNVIPPQPTPMSFAVQRVVGQEGRNFVVLTVFSAAGQFVVFLDGDGAEKLSEELAKTGKAARSGLIVPASSEVVEFSNRAERRRQDRGA